MLNRTRMLRCMFRGFSRNISTGDSATNTATTQVELKNGIKTITLNHPKTRNALSIQMMQNLVGDLTKDQDNPDLRVIVINHTGPVFSSGHNLKELSSGCPAEQHKHVFSIATNLMRSILESQVPVIARVDGLAAAAGCQLVAQCDLAVCTPRSTFSTPGASFGIFCSTPGIALGRAIGRSKALYMLLTGLPISSKEALEAGLVTAVAEQEVIDGEISRICGAIMSKSRSVICDGKRFFNKQIDLDVLAAYHAGEEAMVSGLASPDGKEGIDSFMQKRKPVWKHV